MIYRPPLPLYPANSWLKKREEREEGDPYTNESPPRLNPPPSNSVPLGQKEREIIRT